MVEVTAQLDEGMSVALSNGRHKWIGDEPHAQKGTDTGPSPYELLLSSLAACTCITMRLYCDHKNIRLTSVQATYVYEKVPASDLSGPDVTGLVDRISGSIKINGDFDDAQRKRLTDIASRCPVHKTLAKGSLMVDDVTFGNNQLNATPNVDGP
jgi:putative redox protein